MAERIDRTGEFRTQLAKNKKIILRTQNICGICGQPVDMSLKYPDPMSKTVDHITPIAKGGHPSDLANLQLAHRWCNRWKGDRLFLPGREMLAGAENHRGMKNDQDLKKTGGIKRDEKNIEKCEIIETDAKREETDNNDLPLHADWQTLTW